MKKGKKITMPMSVEAQIRTRARNLPVDRCYVSHEWEETGLAEVVVTRKHVNGNITFGFYVVDLFLLGVKDCFYGFNESPADVEERLELSDDFEECDYTLAHNIIFEGIAFAEECGFEPAKNFVKTAKFILEEDTDDIPQMDIPVGKYGIPVIFVTPENNMQREIAVLDKTVGHDNYIICHVDEDGNFVDEDDEDYDENDEDYDEDDNRFFYDNYYDAKEEIISIGAEQFIENYGVNMTTTELMALTDIFYEAQFGSMDDINIHELIIDDDRYNPVLNRLPELGKHTDSIQSIIDKMDDDKETALAEMEALAAAHPDDVYVGVTHIALLFDLGTEEDLERLILYWYDRASDHYAFRMFYAKWLTVKERFDEVLDMFGNHPGLDAITKEDLPFTEDMVCDFCACYVLAWLSKDNIAKAEPYYQLLLIMDNVTKLVNDAFLAMVNKKKKVLVGSLSSELQT